MPIIIDYLEQYINIFVTLIYNADQKFFILVFKLFSLKRVV
jgi:hypothetical protein